MEYVIISVVIYSVYYLEKVAIGIKPYSKAIICSAHYIGLHYYNVNAKRLFAQKIVTVEPMSNRGY
jgi:hypothetical protein